MINAQEAKYLQKIDDGLVKTFEIIEETIRDTARNGQSRVEISFAFSDLPEGRYADVAAILKNLNFEVSFSSYGTLLISWWQIWVKIVHLIYFIW